ncbi:hypothetical protein [Streptomyces sp. TRM49041]|uniref:hypothetical protein n=1 Tax=Streptomyces sp. TRM49041 TaxID=2603216 RepID=UPI0016568461|nr:hypothetical protein [Streptomyces sp. TRM49041]
MRFSRATTTKILIVGGEADRGPECPYSFPYAGCHPEALTDGQDPRGLGVVR